jgi:hypothetical protein
MEPKDRRSPVKPRPQWVKALYSFVKDGIIDDQYGYPMNGEDDAVLTEIEAAVDEVLCRLYGHEVIDDQCGKPEHRYCMWCGRIGADDG